MIKKVYKYLRFLLLSHSRHGHGIHSPFVFDLFSRVLAHRKDESHERLLQWRRTIENDNSEIGISTFGAGSVKYKPATSRAGELSKLTAMPHTYGCLLSRLIREFKPATIIELGTGLGISTAYMASATGDAQVYSMEGSAERLDLARNYLQRLNLQNIVFLEGEFDAHFPDLLKGANHPLFVFIDGNHKYEPSLRYFHMVLDYARENTIMVFDDIHWSGEMERAWNEIIANEKLTLSIDLFRCGLVFFRKGIPKQHFLVNYQGFF